MSPAAQLATLLLEHLKMAGKPDLDEVCRALGLRVREKDLVGFEGTLVRSRTAQKGIIGVKRSVREVSRKRFTVAHEIGHSELGDDPEAGPPMQIEPARSAEPSPVGLDRVVDYGRRQRREVQMDLFAREFLLPREFVRQLHLAENLSATEIA